MSYERSDRPRLPWSVGVLTALWGALLLGASLVWPMGSGYDEPTHLDMAYVYAHAPFAFYGPGELSTTKAIAGMQGQAGGFPPRRPLAERPLPPREQRPSLQNLGGPQVIPGGQPNQMVQHPPLSYWAYAVVLRLPGVAHLGWDLQIWLLRLLGVLMVLPVPALCFGAARRLLLADGLADSVAERLSLVAAVLPLTIPNLARDAASVNSDVLLIASCSVVLYLTVRVLTGDLRIRTATGISISLAVALLTKGYALVLPPVVLAAYGLSWWRRRRRRSVSGVLWPLLVIAAGGVVGGVWWLRNLVLYGVVQPTGYGDAFVRQHWGVTGDADDGRIRDFLGPFLTSFVERIWGGIGLADSLTPGAPIVFGWAAFSLVGVVLAVTVRAAAPANARRRGLVLTAALVLTVLVVMQGSLALWERKAIGPAAAQGRYVYHLGVAAGALVVVGWARVLRAEVTRRLPVVVLLAGLLTQVMAWVVVLRSWYGTHDSLGSAASALLDRSPVVPAATITLVVVLPLLTGICALVCLLAVGAGEARHASGRHRHAGDGKCEEEPHDESRMAQPGGLHALDEDSEPGRGETPGGA